jgi:hypothetical protein
MQNYKPLDENSNAEDLIAESLRCMKLASIMLDTNLLDNYGYREYSALVFMKQFLPSAKKVIGRTGDDASAPEEGYHHIEQKSGTVKTQSLTMAGFSKMEFDKQGDSARRDKLFNYDGFCLSAFEQFEAKPIAMVFVTKEHISKLHPLIAAKQQEKLNDFENKIKNKQNIGRDSIKIELKEILDYIAEEDLICWLYGEKIDSVEFFRKIRKKEIKTNNKFKSSKKKTPRAKKTKDVVEQSPSL